MRRTFLALALLLLGSAFAAPGARAVLLYSNPPVLGAGQGGDCTYNTECATRFAAQLFTLSQAATVTGVGFNAALNPAAVIFTSAANWKILDNDGPGGLPGTVLASGSGAAVSHVAGPVGVALPTIDYSFAIPATALAAGDYYIAIQAVTTYPQDFLSRGTAGGGAAQTDDGGATWTAGFGSQRFSSVAVSLTGEFTAVPEPASLALFGLGLGGLALARRRAQR